VLTRIYKFVKNYNTKKKIINCVINSWSPNCIQTYGWMLTIKFYVFRMQVIGTLVAAIQFVFNTVRKQLHTDVLKLPIHHAGLGNFVIIII